VKLELLMACRRMSNLCYWVGDAAVFSLIGLLYWHRYQDLSISLLYDFDKTEVCVDSGCGFKWLAAERATRNKVSCCSLAVIIIDSSLFYGQHIEIISLYLIYLSNIISPMA
jgi:hypothetical protein